MPPPPSSPLPQLEDGTRVKKVPIVIEGGRGPHLLPSVADPVLAQLNLCQYMGVVSERFQDALEGYVKRNPHSVLMEDDEEVEEGGPPRKVRGRETAHPTPDHTTPRHSPVPYVGTTSQDFVLLFIGCRPHSSHVRAVPAVVVFAPHPVSQVVALLLCPFASWSWSRAAGSVVQDGLQYPHVDEELAQCCGARGARRCAGRSVSWRAIDPGALVPSHSPVQVASGRVGLVRCVTQCHRPSLSIPLNLCPCLVRCAAVCR
jgi:hypothetical protein